MLHDFDRQSDYSITVHESIRVNYFKTFYMLSLSVFSNYLLRNDIDIMYARRAYLMILNISSTYKNTKKKDFVRN